MTRFADTSGFKIRPRDSLLWEGTFMGFVILLAVVLLVTVVGRVAQAGEVWWVYGAAGHSSGIRVYLVGKEHRFTNGDPVPSSVATAASVGEFVASILLSYLILYSVRHVYRLSRKGKHENG